MRLRRQMFHPGVHTTAERGRPITLTLAGLQFDLDVDEAKRFADDLWDAIEATEGLTA